MSFEIVLLDISPWYLYPSSEYWKECRTCLPFTGVWCYLPWNLVIGRKILILTIMHNIWC